MRLMRPGAKPVAVPNGSVGSRIAKSSRHRRRGGASRTLATVRFDETLEIDRAMAIYAHPDDAEFGMAGTVAKWAKAGVRLVYCMVTNGASGSDDPEMTRQRLRDIRLEEQREAARILGVAEVVFLDFEDGYLEPTIDVRRAVARQIRIHRPDAILTMDPTLRFGGHLYAHPPGYIGAGAAVPRPIHPDAASRLMIPAASSDEASQQPQPKGRVPI